MSTYDGSYSKSGSDYGARVCCCSERWGVNMFCEFHGKFGNGGFVGSEEFNEIKEAIEEERKRIDNR